MADEKEETEEKQGPINRLRGAVSGAVSDVAGRVTGQTVYDEIRDFTETYTDVLTGVHDELRDRSVEIERHSIEIKRLARRGRQLALMTGVALAFAIAAIAVAAVALLR